MNMDKLKIEIKNILIEAEKEKQRLYQEEWEKGYNFGIVEALNRVLDLIEVELKE
jgi:hypothetical protein